MSLLCAIGLHRREYYASEWYRCHDFDERFRVVLWRYWRCQRCGRKAVAGMIGTVPRAKADAVGAKNPFDEIARCFVEAEKKRQAAAQEAKP